MKARGSDPESPGHDPPRPPTPTPAPSSSPHSDFDGVTFPTRPVATARRAAAPPSSDHFPSTSTFTAGSATPRRTTGHGSKYGTKDARLSSLSGRVLRSTTTSGFTTSGNQPPFGFHPGVPTGSVPRRGTHAHASKPHRAPLSPKQYPAPAPAPPPPETTTTTTTNAAGGFDAHGGGSTGSVLFGRAASTITRADTNSK